MGSKSLRVVCAVRSKQAPSTFIGNNSKVLQEIWALSALEVEVGEAERVCVLHQLLRKVVELPRSHACMQHGHTCQPLNAHDSSSIHIVVYTCTAPSGTTHKMPFNTHGMICARARPLTEKANHSLNLTELHTKQRGCPGNRGRIAHGCMTSTGVSCRMGSCNRAIPHAKSYPIFSTMRELSQPISIQSPQVWNLGKG